MASGVMLLPSISGVWQARGAPAPARERRAALGRLSFNLLPSAARMRGTQYLISPSPKIITPLFLPVALFRFRLWIMDFLRQLLVEDPVFRGLAVARRC